MTASAVALVLLIGAFYALFYTLALPRMRGAVEPFIRHSGALADHPRRQVDALAKLVLAATCQGTFAVLLATVLRQSWPALFGMTSWALWPLAVALGAGELVVASLLCSVVVNLHPHPMRLLTASGAGWMGQFRSSRRLASTWQFVAVTAVYVTGEELIFRAVLIELVRPVGMSVAIGASVIIFLGAQMVGMPNLDAATFPLAGAAVIGSTHAVIYWYTGAVGPLALAHLTFMLGTLVRVSDTLGTTGVR